MFQHAFHTLRYAAVFSDPSLDIPLACLLTSAACNLTLLSIGFQEFGQRSNCPDGPNTAVAILDMKMSELKSDLPFT